MLDKKSWIDFKPEQLVCLGANPRALTPGIYKNEHCGPIHLVVGEESRLKVFEFNVDFGHKHIKFVTDSVEVLKLFASRGFPLNALAEFFGKDIMPSRQRDENFMDIWIRTGQGDVIESANVRFRIISAFEVNTYEVRLIKS